MLLPSPLGQLPGGMLLAVAPFPTASRPLAEAKVIMRCYLLVDLLNCSGPSPPPPGQMCRLHNWQSLRLDGSCSVKQRQPIVDTFNDPAHPSFVLLLSSKAGGVGLNIIGANRLVLFDPGGWLGAV